MDAKSLMIGDWVYSDVLKNPFQIGRPSDFRFMYEKKHEVFDDNGELRYIHPIPLTGEILKLNGFVSKRKYGLHFYLPHKGFEIFECFDGGGIDVVGYGLTINKKTVGIYYVHQLQHTLRLAGLNELADNLLIK